MHGFLPKLLVFEAEFSGCYSASMRSAATPHWVVEAAAALARSRLLRAHGRFQAQFRRLILLRGISGLPGVGSSVQGEAAPACSSPDPFRSTAAPVLLSREFARGLNRGEMPVG